MAIESYFHGLWGRPVIDAIAVAVSRYGLIVCFLALGVAWLRRRPHGAVLPAIAAAMCCGVALWVAGLVYQEPRPFVALSVTPLLAHAADNAFPSDHSVAAAYAATLTGFIDPPLGIIAWLVAIVLGLARTYCLLHTPLDVIAGWVLGAAPAAAAGVWLRTKKGRP